MKALNRLQKSFLKTAAFFAVVAAAAGALYRADTTTFNPSPVVCGSISATAFFGICWLIVYEVSGGETRED